MPEGAEKPMHFRLLVAKGVLKPEEVEATVNTIERKQ